MTVFVTLPVRILWDTSLPAGGFDLDHLDGTVQVRFASTADSFTSLGQPGTTEAAMDGEVVVVIVSAAPARADLVPCGTLGGRDWELVGMRGVPTTWVYESYDYLSFDSTPTFNISDTRIAVNDLDAPATVTFASQQSRTWSIEVSRGMTASLTKALSLSVSARIQQSWTTAIGVSVPATVPPHSGVRGDYGTQAFDVTFEAHMYRKEVRPLGSNPSPLPSTRCFDLGVNTYHVNAPTDLEGWRVGPL